MKFGHPASIIRRVPKKTKPSPVPGKPVKKEFSCPYRGESGYVRARFIRDLDKPGWLVLYDRALGDVAGMAHIEWDERTRYVLMWRPVPGESGKVKYKAGPHEQWAKEPLAWAARGRDALGLWGGQPVTVARQSSAVSQACAHNARSETPPAPTVPDKPASGIPAGAVPGKLPRPKALNTRESDYDLVLLRNLPLDTAAERLAYISQSAMKTTFSNGVPVDVEDWKVRLEALKEYHRMVLLAADKREKEKVQRELDESDLLEMLQTEVGREMLRTSAELVINAILHVERTGEVPEMKGLHLV